MVILIEILGIAVLAWVFAWGVAAIITRAKDLKDAYDERLRARKERTGNDDS